MKYKHYLCNKEEECLISLLNVQLFLLASPSQVNEILNRDISMTDNSLGLHKFLKNNTMKLIIKKERLFFFYTQDITNET